MALCQNLVTYSHLYFLYCLLTKYMVTPDFARLFALNKSQHSRCVKGHGIQNYILVEDNRQNESNDLPDVVFCCTYTEMRRTLSHTHTHTHTHIS